MDMKDLSRKHGAGDPATVPGISGTHFHPADVGCILSCDEMKPPSEWLWAGNQWSTTKRPPSSVGRIAAVDVAVDDPATTAAKWNEMLGIVTDATPAPTTVHLVEDGTTVRFVPKRRPKDDGMVAFDVFTSDDALAGTVSHTMLADSLLNMDDMHHRKRHQMR